MRLPKFLQSYLPSYNISRMDLRNLEDRELVIEAVLNRGTLKDVKWLFSVYDLEEIKNIVKNPRRGCWDKRVLNFWVKFLKIKINPSIYDIAVWDIGLDPEMQKKRIDFIKKNASEETVKMWREIGLMK